MTGLRGRPLLRCALLAAAASCAIACGTVSTEIENRGASGFPPRPEGYPIVLSGKAASLVDAPSLQDAALKVCAVGDDAAKQALVDAATQLAPRKGVFDAGPFRHLATVALSRPRGVSDDGDGPFADAMRKTARELGGDVVEVRVVARRGQRIERVKAEIYRLECGA